MQEGLFFSQTTIHHFRHRLAITFSCESLTCNAFFYQIVHHALRSSLRKIHVVGVTSTIIGVGSQFNGDVRIVGEQFCQSFQGRGRLWRDLCLVKWIKHIAHKHRDVHRRKRELQNILMLLIEDRIYLKLVWKVEIATARRQEDISHPRMHFLFKRTIGLHGKFEVSAITSHHLHLCCRKFVPILFVHPTFHSEQAFRIGELKDFVPSSTSGRA